MTGGLCSMSLRSKLTTVGVGVLIKRVCVAMIVLVWVWRKELPQTCLFGVFGETDVVGGESPEVSFWLCRDLQTVSADLC